MRVRESHRWFRSGRYSLLGHTESPATYGALGAVIVPPFGWEDICCYRPLRFLARVLADAGIPVLRFDLPGAGDSSGSALDSKLFPAWIQSVEDAAGELRSIAGVQQVAVVGVRLGSLLAMIAAARESNLHDLVLWAPPSSGHAEIRELRAFANMERREYTSPAPVPKQPFPGLASGGFLLSPETQRDLEAADLSRLSGLRGRRVLLLSRDNVRPDPKLVESLEAAGCAVRVETGAGYAAMMTPPNEIPPAATGGMIAQFLARGAPDRTMPHSPDRATAVMETPDGAVAETIYPIHSSCAAMFGVLSEPADRTSRAACCALFLNAGAVRHIGPNRMWVEAARRWAARGVTALRLDLPGIGESEGDPRLDIPGLYREVLVDQVELAMRSLRYRFGFQSFVAIGLCSGAFWAFHAALRNPEIRSAILLNPRLFFWDPEVDQRRAVRRTARALTNWWDWCKVARGDIPLQDLKRLARILLKGSKRARSVAPPQIPPGRLTEAWDTLGRQGTRVALVFTEGEPLLIEMEAEAQMPPETNSRICCIRVTNAGHTFRPVWAQAFVHDVIDGELDAVVRETQRDAPATRTG
jgi:pimeloyl-ACP methyl ester carboxylesterase